MTSESTKVSNLQSSKYYQSSPSREHCIFHRRRKDIRIFKRRTVVKTIVLPFKICPSSFYEMGNHMWRHSSPWFVSLLMPMKISSYWIKSVCQLEYRCQVYLDIYCSDLKYNISAVVFHMCALLSGQGVLHGNVSWDVIL